MRIAALAIQAISRNAGPRQRLKRQGIDFASWLAAGAERAHAGRREMVEQRLGQNAAAAVGGAEKENLHGRS